MREALFTPRILHKVVSSGTHFFLYDATTPAVLIPYFWYWTLSILMSALVGLAISVRCFNVNSSLSRYCGTLSDIFFLLAHLLHMLQSCFVLIQKSFCWRSATTLALKMPASRFWQLPELTSIFNFVDFIHASH